MSFPASPVLNEVFIADGKAWKFDGTNWVIPKKASTLPWELVTGKPDYFPAKVIYSAAPPANALVGTAWWDQNNSVLYVYDGAAWVESSQSFRTGDLDAWDYIYRVQAADGQDLEDSVIAAMLKFVIGCKTDGIWDAIKASCVMAGARTLNGALVPLKGTAPTNVNFQSTDYDRKTGLKGDASTKYLISNRLNNADPVTNKHIFAYATEGPTGGDMTFIGSERQFSNSGAGESSIFTSPGASQLRVLLNDTYETVLGSGELPGHDGTLPNIPYGLTRSPSSPDVVNWLVGNKTGSYTRAAGATASANRINVFRHRDSGGGNTYAQYSNARMSFYSIGESLGLSTLNTRVSTLMTDLNIAIP